MLTLVIRTGLKLKEVKHSGCCCRFWLQRARNGDGSNRGDSICCLLLLAAAAAAATVAAHNMPTVAL
jgi:hypothetical protein